MNYIPKGGMCANCKNNKQDCSVLPFKDMKPAKKYPDGTIAVICDKYSK